MERLERRVRLVGGGSAWTVERALAAKLGLGVTGLVAGVVLAGGSYVGRSMLMIVVLAVFGFVSPDLILWGRAAERQQVIRRALPDALDQLTICVESGLGFDAALKRVADRGTGPLADELRQTLSEIAMGVPRSDALGSLAERTDVPELRHFVLAVRQADGYGVPVARVLRIQASQLRMRRRQAAEERALKMPVKITFPLVTCIFPALFIVLLGPAMIRVARTLLL
jgi:tight adherence protein C